MTGWAYISEPEAFSRHTVQNAPAVVDARTATCLAGRRHARHTACRAADYNTRLQQARADDLEFARLLTGPADIEQGRARSASDAGVLRRKGRLKEQDQFIDFIVSMHQTHSCEEVMTKVQQWVQASVASHHRCTLRSRSPPLLHTTTDAFTSPSSPLGHAGAWA